MRVLALADACNPEWPSLPVVGFQYAKALARHVDLTVVTQVRNRANIEKVGLGDARVSYVDTEWIAKPLFAMAKRLRGGDEAAWTVQVAMDYPGYLAFEWAVWRRFREDLLSGAFDVVHRLTPMSPALPSPLAGYSPVPFVLGPLNGNLPWPSAFNAELSREREWLGRLRAVYKLMPYHRRTFRNAKAILAAFEHTMRDVPPGARTATINFPEVGVDPEMFTAGPRPSRDKVTIMFAGRLVPLKMVEILVLAFANSPILRRHRLLIVGDGPERARLEPLVSQHGLADCVALVGRKTQAEVSALMSESDIFAFPSIRELGAGVVVEAMASGLACVVADYGGPAALIDDDRGLKIPVTDRATMTDAFQRALERMVQDRGLTARLGTAAQHHARAHYTWDAKARKTREIYEWVAGQRGAKPDYFLTAHAT